MSAYDCPTVNIGHRMQTAFADLVVQVPDQGALAALCTTPAGSDLWWSHHYNRGCVAKANWHSARFVAVDLDFHDERDMHTAPSPAWRAWLFHNVTARLPLPPSVIHPTPRGERLIWQLSTWCSRPSTYALASGGACEMVLAQLRAAMGVTYWQAGFRVDRPASTSLAPKFRGTRGSGVATFSGAVVTTDRLIKMDPGNPLDVPLDPGHSPCAPPPRREDYDSLPPGLKRWQDAKDAYLNENPLEPDEGRGCPACGHSGCCNPFPHDERALICFSASHERDSGGVGRAINNGNAWVFDALDVEAHSSGSSPTEILRREGHLERRR